jgi:PAS domain S-box-containing protein
MAPDHDGDTTARSASVTELLAAWRAAERRWERVAPADEVSRSALQVVTAWAAYQDAALPAEGSEFLLAADDDGVYVGATLRESSVLGYQPSELIGMRVADIAAPELRPQTPQEWARFLAAGRQDGRYRLQAKDGRLITVRYQARAHHPVPGFHVSRLWPEEDDPAHGGSERDAAGPL